jgi:hypothetical protein
MAYWRGIVGFMMAFLTAWLGGGYLMSLLLFRPGAGEGMVFRFFVGGSSVTQFVGKSMLWALIGAGYGVYRARSMLKAGCPAPLYLLFKQVPSILFAIIGITAGLVLSEYRSFEDGEKSSIVARSDVAIPMTDLANNENREVNLSIVKHQIS